MRETVQTFSTALLDQVRTSNELEIILNYDPDPENAWEPGESHSLERLKLAIKCKLKSVSNIFNIANYFKLTRTDACIISFKYI